jgi:hypothetical protein
MDWTVIGALAAATESYVRSELFTSRNVNRAAVVALARGWIIHRDAGPAAM